MADTLLKVLAFNDEVKAVAMVATDAIAEAQRRHDTWSSATAAMGRAIIGTQLLASSLKGDERITVQVNGDGPGGKIMADANGRGEISEAADYPIEAVTGAEAIMGSTRMKAGTAQKLILNMISTSVMIKLGKVYQNYMVDVKPTNKKLVVRSKNMIRTLTGVDEERAEQLYEASGHNVKKALVMEIMNVDKETAEEALSKGDGHIKRAIQYLGGDV